MKPRVPKTSASSVLLLINILAVSLTTAIPSWVHAQKDDIVLQLLWKHQFEFAGYYAAVEKGFFAQNNLNVTLREASAGMKFVETLTSGDADYLVGLPAFMLERAKGAPIIALAAIFQHSPLVMVTQTDVIMPSDLSGRPLVLNPEANAEILAIFLREGISIDSLNIVKHSMNDLDLDKNEIAGLATHLTQLDLLDRSGKSYNVISPLTYGIDFYGDCLFTLEEKIQKHPERVRAFLTAVRKGWIYALDHPDDIIEVIKEKYNAELSRDNLRLEAQTVQHLVDPKRVEIGHMNPGRWQHIATTYKDLGMLNQNFDPKVFFYDPHSAPRPKWIPQAVTAIGTAALIVSVSFCFNLLFKRQVRQRTSDLQKVNAELVKEIAKLRDDNKWAKDFAERKAQELESFSYTVSHDLKAPVRGIEGFSQILEDDHVGQLDADAQHCLNMVRHSAGHMNQLIEDLLTYSRLDRMAFELQKVNLPGLLQSLLDARSDDLAEYRVALEMNVGNGTIWSEKEALGHILGNLIDNAIKFSRDEPEPQVHIEISETDLEWMVKVADNGIGFDMKHQDRIFVIFRRLEKPEKYPGTGVGLAIVKKMVDRLGGRVWVEAAAGKGSTFFVALPKRDITID